MATSITAAVNFMISLTQDIQPKVHKLLKKHLIPVFDKAFEVEHERMKKAVGIIDSASSEEQLWDELQQLVAPTWLNSENNLLIECLPIIVTELENEFDLLDETKTFEQSRERFYPIEGDKASLRLVKKIKRQLFYFSKLNVSVLNRFRKNKKDIKFWNHTVPVRHLALRNFQNILLNELLELLIFYHQKISEGYSKVRTHEHFKYGSNLHSEDDFNISVYLESLLLSVKEEQEEKIDLILRERSEQFTLELGKGGTIELPKRALSRTKLDHEKYQIIKKWEKLNLNWNNTRFAFFEDWRLDLELFLLKWKCEHEYDFFLKAQTNYLSHQIEPIAKSIQSQIEDSLTQLDLEETDVGGQLRNINDWAENELNNQKIPQLIDKLANENIIALINRLERHIKDFVQILTDERVIVKNDSFLEALASDELKKISPNELIRFEALSQLEKEISHVKQSLFIGIDTISHDLSDIGQIISYSCESALVCLEEEGKTLEESYELALQGINRAKNRLTTSMSDLESLLKHSPNPKQEIDKFNEAILELTVNQNITELRLRITKAKATKQAEDLKKELKVRISTAWGSAKTGAIERANKVKDLFKKLSSRFILTAAEPVANREISDFLVESQNAIDKLPLIYRRLYRIEPLTDLDLFEGREQELSQLKNAYVNWTKGRFAATVIVGEKSGGLTTFINYLVNQSNYPIAVIRHEIKRNIANKEELLEKLASILDYNEFESIEHVIRVLNDGEKKIIILEDLQNLYFRKIGGFEALTALCQIIANTGKNVYWITTFTLYSWQYLVKAMNVQEFFSYVVQMGLLTDNQIVDLIWKRNRISGFNIQFEPDESLLKEKKFRKLNENDQQAWLKDRYFTSLNEFAHSNISLALIFWLLSTKKVDESTITIGTFQKPNINFISILSADKVHVLLALILHDGLTTEQLYSFLGTTESSSRMTLLALVEDGIVLKSDDLYGVNPLVYRNAISMLTSKNLLH